MTERATSGAGDDKIDRAKELVFTQWLPEDEREGKTDLQVLAEAVDDNGNKVFDTNGDEMLTADDAVWAELRVWRHLNQDGVTDDGEH